MNQLRIVGLNGSLSTTSRTRMVVQTAVERIAAATTGSSHIIDVADLAGLGGLRSRATASPAVENALSAVETADLLVVGTPVYKGSYTGVLKHFIDFVEYRALIGLPVGLIASGGSERHALVVEYQLRPLFGFFQAKTLATGLFLSDRDIATGTIVDPILQARLDQLVSEGIEELQERTAESVAAE